ncbi:PPC domain-containing protein [Haloarchaeobius baliensis]|uniref:PPC domain-containing protein n=1 Tax=Haloarchaeobius baliensis TaxID=1670458 RepID=UPI003F8825B5
MGTLESLTGGGGVSLPVDGSPEHIDYGASVSGRLTTDSPSDPEYEGHYEPYTFRGSAGDIVRIRLRSSTGDPYLFLIDDEGTLLAANDDDSMSFNSAISGFELPEDGGYGILAGSWSNTVGFGYELSLSKVEADIDSIAVGETRTSTLDSTDPRSNRFNGYHERVTLDADTGTTVDIAMRSSGDTYLYLLDPSGSVVAQNDDYDGLNSRIRNVTLSASGEYTIIATSFSPGATFVYDLTVQEV